MKRMKRLVRWLVPILAGIAIFNSPLVGSWLGRALRWAGPAVTQLGVALDGGLTADEAYNLIRSQLPERIGIHGFSYDAETGRALVDVAEGKAKWAAQALKSTAGGGDPVDGLLDRIGSWFR